MPRVAVVIPNRNRAGLLRRTLESVAGQTAAASRVVVGGRSEEDT
ncbi:MAG TPA: glycosyl transferase family 2, partial [Solibacterales bacterium]|nr:glycosyl transferase family 2 [Bryobacterales bacterium]